MKQTKYSDEEIDFILEHKDIASVKWMADELDRSVRGVRNKLRELVGVRVKHKPPRTHESPPRHGGKCIKGTHVRPIPNLDICAKCKRVVCDGGNGLNGGACVELERARQETERAKELAKVGGAENEAILKYWDEYYHYCPECPEWVLDRAADTIAAELGYSNDKVHNAIIQYRFNGIERTTKEIDNMKTNSTEKRTYHDWTEEEHDYIRAHYGADMTTQQIADSMSTPEETITAAMIRRQGRNMGLQTQENAIKTRFKPRSKATEETTEEATGTTDTRENEAQNAQETPIDETANNSTEDVIEVAKNAPVVVVGDVATDTAIDTVVFALTNLRRDISETDMIINDLARKLAVARAERDEPAEKINKIISRITDGIEMTKYPRKMNVENGKYFCPQCGNTLYFSAEVMEMMYDGKPVYCFDCGTLLDINPDSYKKGNGKDDD